MGKWLRRRFGADLVRRAPAGLAFQQVEISGTHIWHLTRVSLVIFSVGLTVGSGLGDRRSEGGVVADAAFGEGVHETVAGLRDPRLKIIGNLLSDHRMEAVDHATRLDKHGHRCLDRGDQHPLGLAPMIAGCRHKTGDRSGEKYLV